MAHERQEIRNAVVAQLVGPSTYVTTAAGPRVFKTRGGPVREADLPCLCVFAESESVDASNTSTTRRSLKLVVEGYVKVAPGADLDAAMDALALQVETAMDADPYLAGCARYIELSSTTLETSVLGSQPMGRAALEYTVHYEAPIRVDDATDAFATADIHTSLGGTQAPADQTHDVVTLP
jgi:hypothetical protein